jgi:ribosomal protein S27AE
MSWTQISKEKQDQVKSSKCPNCGNSVAPAEAKNNKGYCNECAFEAWGEGEPS